MYTCFYTCDNGNNRHRWTKIPPVGLKLTLDKPYDNYFYHLFNEHSIKDPYIY